MSKFLSLEWFKSKVEQTVETVISKKIEKLMDEVDTPSEKPYSNIKLVNDVLTIVLTDGSILSKQNATQSDFAAVKCAKSEEDILNIVACPMVVAENLQKKKEADKITALQKGISVLKSLPDFTVEENTVYLTGTSRSMPQLLVEKFIEIVDGYTSYSTYDEGVLQEVLNKDEEYLAHKRFFLWCCLNPRAEVADELYRFLQDNSFRITKQGFFVALRNVVTLHGGKEIVDFITNAYTKVKAVWKKSPANYTVFLHNGEYKIVHCSDLYVDETISCPTCDGEGEYWDEDIENYVDCNDCNGEGTISGPVQVNHGKLIGNLTDLYLDLPNMAENRYTDDWTKTFDIRIGQVVSMPKEECNWSTQDCAAAGLHFTADQIHYVGCGDQSVLVLINPMKVVGIGQHKGRCYEYLPIMTVPRDEATKILHDVSFDTLQLDDDFTVRELDNLEDQVKEGFAVESKKYNFSLPSITSEEIKKIILSLDDMKSVISNRVKTVN